MDSTQIYVLDFGGQYAHLIARRCRELGVSAKICDPNDSISKYKNSKGLILSGGPGTVKAKNAPKFNKQIFKLGLPLFGICYGHQVIADVMGGKLKTSKESEYGKATLETKPTGIFKDLPKKQTVWMNHGDSVIKAPQGCEVIAITHGKNITAMQNIKKKIFSVQFHPEVKHTPKGKKIISNFLFNYCKCKKDWNLKGYIKRKTKEIQKQVGNRQVFAFVSGGVDSMTGIALLKKALPTKQIHPVFVDTGLMRLNEPMEVKLSAKKIGINLKVLNKKKEFLSKLKGVTNAEKKRNIIGSTFLKVKRDELKKIKLKNYIFFQGTIYPDTIESKGTKHSKKIKTHHNRVKEIQTLINQGRVIEPLSELYKDEVRILGKLLGLDKKIVERHPFPGPGLGVRILCSGTTKNIKHSNFTLKLNLAKNINLKKDATATLLPIKSVGVQGDNRTYVHPILLQNISLKNAKEITPAILNKHRIANRLIVDTSKMPDKKFSQTKLEINSTTVNLLQKADKIAMTEIKKAKLDKKIWQFPVVLAPIATNISKYSIILRPIESVDGMTADSYILPQNTLTKIVNKITKETKIKSIFYDVTSKPPSTIEWE